jgi:hypothetical protein
MAIFNGAFPILPGKEADARAFAKEVTGPRKADYDTIQRRQGITRETWSFQETPAGAFMLVWIEAEDIDAAFGDMAAANDAATVWLRGRVQEVTGVDMTQPAEGAPELLVEWSA